MDQELVDAAAYALGRRCVCAHQMAALLCDVMADIFNMWHIIKNKLMHIYLKNNPAKFHPNLIWNDEALGFFEDNTPTRTTTRWVTIKDQYIEDEDWRIYMLHACRFDSSQGNLHIFGNHFFFDMNGWVVWCR